LFTRASDYSYLCRKSVFAGKRGEAHKNKNKGTQSQKNSVALPRRITPNTS
jgi:hypothetical protein